MQGTCIPNTIEVIEKLRWNAHLNKHIHFNASKRDRKLHVWVGVPVVIITVILSVFLTVSSDRSLSATEFQSRNSVSSESREPYTKQIRKKHFPIWVEWVGAVLALIAAVLGGIQTFFNFQKEYEGHRQIGNQYLSIAKECERLISAYFDQLIELSVLAEKLEILNSKYTEVNSRAECLNVSDKDYKRAEKFQNRKAIKEPSLVERKRANMKIEESSK